MSQAPDFFQICIKRIFPTSLQGEKHWFLLDSRGWIGPESQSLLLISIPKPWLGGIFQYLLLFSFLWANYRLSGEAPSFCRTLWGAGLISKPTCWNHPAILSASLHEVVARLTRPCPQLFPSCSPQQLSLLSFQYMQGRVRKIPWRAERSDSHSPSHTHPRWELRVSSLWKIPECIQS